MNEIFIKKVRNNNDVMIKCCCASCQHRLIRADGERVCANMLLVVEQKYTSQRWLLREGLQNAGMGGGMIRHRVRKEVVIY